MIDFVPLTDEDLLRSAGLSKHDGIVAMLTEIADDGLEDYDGRFLRHAGDLHIDGSFDTDDHDLTVLVVEGDLTVTGLCEDRSNDGPCVVLVQGDLRAKNVLTAGFLEVTGALRAEEAIVGDYNDGGLRVGGDLVAPLYLPFDHPWHVLGKVQAEVLELRFTKPPKVLDPKYFGETAAGYEIFGGTHSDQDMKATLRQGGSILHP
jgi:hypothetical protein